MKNAIKSNITEKRGFTSEMLCLSVDSDRSNNSSQSGLVWIDGTSVRHSLKHICMC